MRGVNATGLRTALWRCDVIAELPHFAELAAFESDKHIVETPFSMDVATVSALH